MESGGGLSGILSPRTIVKNSRVRIQRANVVMALRVPASDWLAYIRGVIRVALARKVGGGAGAFTIFTHINLVAKSRRGYSKEGKKNERQCWGYCVISWTIMRWVNSAPSVMSH